jgi:pimeloyl-ACP methyl ester carboxylesterase
MKVFYLLMFVTFIGCSTTFAQQADSVSGYFHSFDGASIYYELHGKGEPVVLIHGFIVHSNTWKKTALYRQLQREGYQVILLDLRGNGLSDKPHQPEAYANDAQARDVMALMSFLKIKKYNAVGYSRGAIITARLLALDKHVRSAVLGGMGADFTNPQWPRRLMFYDALMGKPVKELESMVKYVQSSGLDQLALAYQQKEQPSTSPKVLSKVKQSVLIICGTEDEDNGSAEQLANMFSHADYKRVPGTHNTAASTKDFANEVIAFLKR